ncbi:MAG: CapA family protein [Candidatus Altimarinota bacterium]
MIQFLGDVYLDKKYNSNINLDNYIFNLEYPISNRGTPAKNKINLIQNTSYIKDTFGKNPIAVCLANNHIMDYGDDAFEDTMKFLEQNNIKYFGAGNKSNNYNNPLLIKMENTTISVSGYSCMSTNAVFGSEDLIGSALLDFELIKQDLKNHIADFKIVQLHWGMEDIPYPTYKDVQLAHQIIDCGADLIIGHHAHMIQSSEIYKGKYIFYGLGNCIFPDFSLDSHFNGNEFTRKSSKKQRKHNKKSIMIEIDSTYNIVSKTLFFDGKSLNCKNYSLSNFIPHSEENFRRKYNTFKKIDMFKKFIESPRIPNISQIKRLLTKEKI